MTDTGQCIASNALRGILRLLAWTTLMGCQVPCWADVVPKNAGAERLTAIKADRIDTVTKGIVENGVILIRGTKIVAVGTNVDIPRTANVIDVSDKTVFPGLISPMCSIGVSAPERGAASHPHYRIADEFYPYQHAYRRALEAGFTTLALVPRGDGITGRGAVIKPAGGSREEMFIVETGILGIGFRADEKIKSIVEKALGSVKSKEDSEEPEIASLIQAVQGEISTFIFCTRPADTVHLLELIADYDKMKPVFIVGPENYRIAERLGKRKCPVVVAASIDSEEFTRNRLNVPDMLSESGVKIACMPVSSGIGGHEDFRRGMAELVKCGLDAVTAKKAMTIHPAEALGVDYRLGSIEKGKDANLLILDGDILNVMSLIHEIMIEGEIVYENPWETAR